MQTVQGDFIWGDALAKAVPALNLVFRTAPASYQIDDRLGVTVRTLGAAGDGVPLFEPVAAKTYAAVLGTSGLFATPDNAAGFIRYLRDQLGNFVAGNGDPVDLSIDIDVDFTSVDDELVDRARLSALTFMKGLYESDANGAVDVDAVIIKRHSLAGLVELVGRDAFLLNRAAYETLLDTLTAALAAEAANPPVAVPPSDVTAEQTINADNAVTIPAPIPYYLPLFVIAFLVDLTGPVPVLAATTAPGDDNQIQRILRSLGTANPDALLKLIKNAFPALFDFPLNTAGIALQPVAGTIELKPADAVVTTPADLALYHLALDYATTDADGNPVETRVQFDWSGAVPTGTANIWAFDFAGEAAIFPVRGDDPLTLTVRTGDGMVVWTKDYRAGNPALATVKIALALAGSGAVSPADRVPLGNLRLRGQILDLTRTATLKDALVAIQVKATGDTDWRIVASAAADAGGNFSMAYPVGAFVAAQAVVSLMPDTPVAIPVHADAGDGHTLSDDFLYLLLTLPATPATPAASDPTKPGCDCPDTKASRLPDQTDLIRSDEYMQDLGNGCLSLSTPNRTLREYSYTAIVRTSDPEIASYTLTKDDTGAFALAGGDRLIKRRAIALNNPVRWQDAPEAHASLNFYQTVSVATGHVLHYKSQFRADGYSLGDLLYSLPLAPGQKKQIAMFDASHALTGTENQTISVSESLAANLVNDRTVADQLGGSLGEATRGSSNAHTDGMSAGLGAAASMGSMGASLGVAGGFSNSNSAAAQDNSRNISQFFSEKLKNGLSQNADSFRAQNATAVTTVAEGQGFNATTEVVANHNHCHSLTMMYFEVLRHYAIFQELTDVEECVFVPLLMTNFTTGNIYKWQDVLAANLLPIPANTYLPAVNGAHPLARAFDAVARRKINYDPAVIDFPDGIFAAETMLFIDGTLQVTVSIPRPSTKYDRILSLPLVNTTVSHQEVDPIETAKNIAIAPFTFGLSMAGGPAMKTVTETIQVRAAIFDAFMTLEANYGSVPPAQAIRVTSFDDVSVPISPLYFAAMGLANPPSVLTLPKDRFFDDNELDRRQWTAYATLMGYTDVHTFLGAYFKGKLISEWDTIFYRDIAPALFERIVANLNFSTTAPAATPGATPPNSYKGITADFATTARYTGGTARMTLNLRGTSSIARQDLPTLLYLQAGGAVAALGDTITFRLEDMTLHYTTAHCTNLLFSGHLGDDLQDGTLLYLPLTSEDKRNPRHEDAVLAAKLIEHLNSNLEYYNKVLWYTLDPDRRYLLLDGFNIQVYDDFGVPLGLKSLASVVKNELLTVAGNALVIPVAAGVKVSPTAFVEQTETGAPATVSLLDHYKPIEPTPPYRLSVPTRGIYAEAMMGQCDSCEKVEENTSQDWSTFQTDTPSAINAITPPTATVTDWKATFKDLASATVGLQKAPDLPAVGAGTAGMTTALTAPSAFKDITGLAANQSNAIETFKANNATVEKMAAAASSLATMEHNTANADKIKEGLDKAKADGSLSDDDHKDLTKQHNQQKIDGGVAAKRKDAADAKVARKATAKPSLKDAAVNSVSQNKHVIASTSTPKGATRTIEVKPVSTVDPGVDAPDSTDATDPADTSTPPAALTSKTVFFKSLDCYGDSLSGSFMITYLESGAAGMGGVHVVNSSDFDTYQISTTSAAPSLQFKITTTNGGLDDDGPSINQTGTLVLKVPADQDSLSLVLQQDGEPRAITTKDSKITADKIQNELNVGGDGSGDKWGVKMALKASYKYASESATTVSSDGTQTFNVILPTNHFKLIPALIGGAAPAATPMPTPAPATTPAAPKP